MVDSESLLRNLANKFQHLPSIDPYSSLEIAKAILPPLNQDIDFDTFFNFIFSPTESFWFQSLCATLLINNYYTSTLQGLRIYLGLSLDSSLRFSDRKFINNSFLVSILFNLFDSNETSIENIECFFKDCFLKLSQSQTLRYSLGDDDENSITACIEIISRAFESQSHGKLIHLVITSNTQQYLEFISTLVLKQPQFREIVLKRILAPLIGRLDNAWLDSSQISPSSSSSSSSITTTTPFLCPTIQEVVDTIWSQCLIPLSSQSDTHSCSILITLLLCRVSSQTSFRIIKLLSSSIDFWLLVQVCLLHEDSGVRKRGIVALETLQLCAQHISSTREEISQATNTGGDSSSTLSNKSKKKKGKPSTSPSSSSSSSPSSILCSSNLNSPWSRWWFDFLRVHRQVEGNSSAHLVSQVWTILDDLFAKAAFEDYQKESQLISTPPYFPSNELVVNPRGSKICLVLITSSSSSSSSTTPLLSNTNDSELELWGPQIGFSWAKSLLVCLLRSELPTIRKSALHRLLTRTLPLLPSHLTSQWICQELLPLVDSPLLFEPGFFFAPRQVVFKRAETQPPNEPLPFLASSSVNESGKWVGAGFWKGEADLGCEEALQSGLLFRSRMTSFTSFTSDIFSSPLSAIPTCPPAHDTLPSSSKYPGILFPSFLTWFFSSLPGDGNLRSEFLRSLLQALCGSFSLNSSSTTLQGMRSFLASKWIFRTFSEPALLFSGLLPRCFGVSEVLTLRTFLSSRLASSNGLVRLQILHGLIPLLFSCADICGQHESSSSTPNTPTTPTTSTTITASPTPLQTTSSPSSMTSSSVAMLVLSIVNEAVGIQRIFSDGSRIRRNTMLEEGKQSDNVCINEGVGVQALLLGSVVELCAEEISRIISQENMPSSKNHDKLQSYESLVGSLFSLLPLPQRHTENNHLSFLMSCTRSLVRCNALHMTPYMSLEEKLSCVSFLTGALTVQLQLCLLDRVGSLSSSHSQSRIATDIIRTSLKPDDLFTFLAGEVQTALILTEGWDDGGGGGGEGDLSSGIKPIINSVQMLDSVLKAMGGLLLLFSDTQTSTQFSSMANSGFEGCLKSCANFLSFLSSLLKVSSPISHFVAMKTDPNSLRGRGRQLVGKVLALRCVSILSSAIHALPLTSMLLVSHTPSYSSSFETTSPAFSLFQNVFLLTQLLLGIQPPSPSLGTDPIDPFDLEIGDAESFRFFASTCLQAPTTSLGIHTKENPLFSDMVMKVGGQIGPLSSLSSEHRWFSAAAMCELLSTCPTLSDPTSPPLQFLEGLPGLTLIKLISNSLPITTNKAIPSIMQCCRLIIRKLVSTQGIMTPIFPIDSINSTPTTTTTLVPAPAPAPITPTSLTPPPTQSPKIIFGDTSFFKSSSSLSFSQSSSPPSPIPISSLPSSSFSSYSSPSFPTSQRDSSPVDPIQLVKREDICSLVSHFVSVAWETCIGGLSEGGGGGKGGGAGGSEEIQSIFGFISLAFDFSTLSLLPHQILQEYFDSLFELSVKKERPHILQALVGQLVSVWLSNPLSSIPFFPSFPRLLLYREPSVSEHSMPSNLSFPTSTNSPFPSSISPSPCRVMLLNFLESICVTKYFSNQQSNNNIQQESNSAQQIDLLSQAVDALVVHLLSLNMDPSFTTAAMIGSPPFGEKLRCWQALCILSQSLSATVWQRIEDDVFRVLTHNCAHPIRVFLEIFGEAPSTSFLSVV